MTFIPGRVGRGYHEICLLHTFLGLVDSIKILKTGLREQSSSSVLCLCVSSKQSSTDSLCLRDAGMV